MSNFLRRMVINGLLLNGRYRSRILKTIHRNRPLAMEKCPEGNRIIFASQRDITC